MENMRNIDAEAIWVERTAVRIMKEAQRDLTTNQTFEPEYARKTTGEMSQEELLTLRYYIYLSMLGVKSYEPVAPAYARAYRILNDVLAAA